MRSSTVAHLEASRHVGAVNDLTLASMDVNGTNVVEQAARVEALMALVRKYGEQGTTKKVEILTPQAVQIVMRVFAEPGITMQTLEKRTGQSLASVSRNLMLLGEWHRLGKPGLGLVECVDDPVERRRKIAFLTKKGRRFVSEVLAIGRPVGEVIEIDAPSATEYLNKSYRNR